MSKKISDFPRITARNDNDFLVIEDAATGAYKSIKVSDFIADLSSGSSENRTQLTYVSSGDTNGVFYYIGTNKNTETWSNPVNASRISITQSSAYDSNHTNIAGLVDRENTINFCSANVGDFYFDIDLKADKNLILEAYSLKGRDWAANHPRNWKIQGSNGNDIWNDLDNKSGITSINQNTWYTASISASSTAYRFFRFLSTGASSSGDNVICLGEIELYGKLLWN